MAQSEREDLRARFDSLREWSSRVGAQLQSITSGRQDKERYARELNGLNESEATEYLRLVGDEQVGAAFSVLSGQLTKTSLARVCLDLLRFPGVKARFFGANALGSCLKGTRDQEASYALAQLIFDSHEVALTRFSAYTSLEIIHFPRLPYPRLAVAATASRELLETSNAREDDYLRLIDWDYVNSVCRGANEKGPE
jgi:hypothetical protein